MRNKPLVSIIMAVYSGQEFLNIAIDSVLLQTYSNIELIIIDDGSTDQSASIIHNYSDARIKYYKQKNQGLPAALNNGIEKSRGKYIARMDADDISEPSRIEKQVKFLEKNKSAGIVGTSFYVIDENGSYLDRSYHLDRPEDIKFEIFVRNPFGHGTIMIRRSVLDEVGHYDKTQPIEDYELWWRVLQQTNGSNITEDLYSWRVVASGMSHGSSEKRQKPINALMRDIWNSNNLKTISLSQIRSGLNHYTKIGDNYLEQYKYMLAALYLGSMKMNKKVYAARLLSKLLLADPSFRYTIRDLKKNPRSHNYNLANIHS